MNKLKPPLSRFLESSASSVTKSFNATINRLSSQGAHSEVLLTYASMLRNHVPSDAYTFPSLLKACTFLNLFSLGRSLHQCIAVKGLSFDAYIASSLVNFYVKFGCTNTARKVFDFMPERNVVPWTSVIGCYSWEGNLEMAYALFNDMRQQGIQPSSVTLLTILSGVSVLAHLRCWHGCAIFYGFMSDITLSNSFLSVYGKCGSIEDSRKIFEYMGEKDLVSWNSLMSIYAQIGNLCEVLQLLKTMWAVGMKPDQQTFGSVLSVAASMGELKLGRSVHCQILRAGFDLDAHVETALIVMYFKGKNIDNAFRIFERSSDKDVVLWTAMISGLVQNESADKALAIFRQMLKFQVKPSTATIASVITACAQSGSFDLGISIHSYVLRQELTLDITAQNSLVTMYAKCGKLNQSFIVFDNMSKRDLVSWNAIIAGCTQNGHICKALLLFNEMRTHCQIPDSITIVSLLQGCASIGALHFGKWMHSFIIRNSLSSCILVDTALVDMYSKCGHLDAAQNCFNKMPCQDLVSWGAIIAGYGYHGKGETALTLYSEFLRSGMKPNNVIFLSVLSSCSHNGLIDQGLNIYQSMTEDFGITPNLEHHACVVDLLSRAGRVEEAYDLYKKTFPEPVLDVLGILLDACRVTGNNKLVEMISKDVLMLRPMNAGNYVQLAHGYASTNNWEGVGEAWTHMRSLGLRKIPGWSFIDIHGTITIFFTGHNSHPQFQEIVSTLHILRKESGKKEEMGIDFEISQCS
ncbi:pentatricopeptide repeat-containing protein At4g04370-like [Neltuma alba]|uniref:pentatricopeptide repeat-containing protein At4g04370-like n=1 Tax=Neltuma alba TaxID=207710 RepID=UPI0010A322FA|nr:pentatricopeptide repeat-containing protein At4g04370-like [Prosopis alba]XP_028793520.1 pentatricopeptide repeat-containing protein At4g04370-like [Prosopis alba]